MASVCTNYGPYQRDCEDGRNALLVEEKPAWREALLKLVSDANYRKTIGEQAYRDAKRTYDLDVMVDRWMDVFGDVEKLKATGG